MAFGVLWLVTGVVIARVGWAGAKGRLPRQHWAGIRLPSTMRSDETWRAAHLAGGPWLFAAGVVPALVGLGLVLTRPSRDVAGPISLAVVAVVLVLVLVGGVLGVRAARRVEP
jgi:uncharacterized membrane protein